MSLDFAQDFLNTNVSCSCVCADSYDCRNLINSKDQWVRLKGFQGERFVKVPVTLQFCLPIPANIHKVVFFPSIGQQCAKTIHLFSSNSYPVSRNINLRDEDLTNGSQFRKCASVALTRCSKVTFLNRGYSPHPDLPSHEDKSDTVLSFTSGNLSNITALRIVIQQMLVGSIPSLAQLHIWGRPARCCSQGTKKEFVRLSKQVEQLYTNPSVLYSTTKQELHTAIQDPKPSTESDLEENRILNVSECGTVAPPDEILDPLTLDIMRFPVMLPSGHTIDRSSLDRHVLSQSEHGNAPSDPFTGIPFTESNKPFPNVKLKARIDQYHLDKRTDKVISNCDTDGPDDSSGIPHELSARTKHFQSYGSPTIKRSHTSEFGHASRVAPSLEESLAEMSQSIKRRRTVFPSCDALPSTLCCCKCATFMRSDSLRYILPCKRVICDRCVKDDHDGVKCPCSSIHEFKSIRRAYHE